MLLHRHVINLTATFLVLLGACTERPTAPARGVSAPSSDRGEPEQPGHLGKVRCDADNAGITLPPGFCALVVADQGVEFDVNDAEAVDTAAQELASKGYELLHATRTEPWGQIVARMQTPEGLILGISYIPSMHQDHRVG